MPTRKPTRTPAKRAERPQNVDDYLAAVPKEAREALLELRQAIRAAAPKATEVISYGVPIFKLDGRPLVGFGAATAHCAFYVMSTQVFRAHAAELKDYQLGKGSIRFPADRPLPAPLVKKLVKARIAENQKRP
jgi:uncharacterized protein YdhG (YjbR/CyaY superfamily)